MALILGTAQLGQTYGIANRTGQPDALTAHAIIATAWEHGIHAFDTAPSYGDAERLLGEVLTAIGAFRTARVTTKLEGTGDPDDDHSIATMVERSRERLRIPRVHRLLVRRVLLDEWQRLRPTLSRLIADGVIEGVGVSVYTPEEALRALEIDGVTSVQVPTNMLDRRFLVSGVFDRARALGKTVAIRSVFLQGLLTMSVADAPPMPGVRVVLQGIRRAADELAMTPIALAIAYVHERCPHADILLGAETPEQVAELVALWAQRAQPCADLVEQYVPVGTIDLIDPTRWRAATHR